ncbi:putative Ig domain-containing protein [Streptomyces sp. ASQP_92]|uniref:putative Ig domain-containing protein n=1 Tax=Streptomyces sp. ASQP_92 TaxID=2979116 RepID=UPI0021C0AD50|nr:putative Ig domain-containing protein [Streptomyces sp. ASQP_92]MCT9094021.1 putative Ig domain-containing protein [Streptomyces sp. ASQP_92]
MTLERLAVGSAGAAGLSVGAASGVISGTPTTWGWRTATLTVTHAAGKKASATVSFTVWF